LDNIYSHLNNCYQCISEKSAPDLHKWCCRNPKGTAT